MEVAHTTCANISHGRQYIKGCHSKDQQRARNVIIPMLLSSSGSSARQTSILTGIHRRNLKSGLMRRLALESKTDRSLWAVCDRQRRVDSLSDHVSKLVEEFWTSNTRISPNRKDVARKCTGVKEWIYHPAHHLTESQLSLYTRFRSEHPAVEIGVRSFEALKPWFVRRMKEFNSCCCRAHVQMMELKEGFNSMRRGSLHKNCECQCEVCRPNPGGSLCMAAHSTFPGVTALCTSVLCPKLDDEEYHKLGCIRGTCEDCGVSTLKKITPFKWQNEVQSQHWFSFQVTILVHITFRIHPEWDRVDPEVMLLTEYHFYISDDKSHDNQFVQYCFGLHNDFLIQQGYPLPVEHIVFSDGCAVQFKCAKNLYFIARYPSLTRTDALPLGCTMQWNWFGTGHGKGRWDGAGAHVKQALRAEQVKPLGLRLHCATDVVQFLSTQMTREYAGYNRARRLVHRHFYDVKENEVTLMPSFNARTVDGTRSLHQVRSVNLEGTSLQVRDLSCFCKFCMDGGDGPCDNVAYVPAFMMIRLEPCEATNDSRRQRGCQEIHEQLIHPRMTAGEARAASLEVGDHFAVLADEGRAGPDFWILQCIETLHAVQEVTKEDTWGQRVYQGKQIVIGTYYKQKGKNMTSFIREDLSRHAITCNYILTLGIGIKV